MCIYIHVHEQRIYFSEETRAKCKPDRGGCWGMKKEGGAPPDIIAGGGGPGGGACEGATPTPLPEGFKTSTYLDRTPCLPVAWGWYG